MKKILTTLAAVAFAASSTAAVAASSVAQLTDFTGKVMVNAGEGFIAPAGISELMVGDKVFVGKDGSAVISYTNGCSVTVTAGTVVSVAPKAPCKAGEVASVEQGFIVPTADTYVPDAAAISPLLLVGGAVVIGTGVYLLTKKKNNSGAPATP